MQIPQSELYTVLQAFNPWWQGRPMPDLPEWERAAAGPVWKWVKRTNSPRALLLTGARQTGKTTIFRQTIRRLLAEGLPAGNVFYATFDHPILKLAGLEQSLQAWSELYPWEGDEARYLFLDEVQYVPDWSIWIKHQVDFHRGYRIAVTGSATPLRDAGTESGVGRWETIPLPTLTFGEFLRLRRIELPPLPPVASLRRLFDWSPAEFARVQPVCKRLTAHFHDYLLRGGFPEPALEPDLNRCQRLLREDIVDKVLKRDMTALYGVRRVFELEKIFLYLCYHDGGILDLAMLSREVEGVSKAAATAYLDRFEAAHLVYRLKPFGYGKTVLRGKDKVYLADPALPGALLLLGQRLLERPERLGSAVETAVFKHLFTRYYPQTPTFSYWREPRRELEVDIIAEVGERIVPFEVKYFDSEVSLRRLKGLERFFELNNVDEGYVVTRRHTDLGIIEANSPRAVKSTGRSKARILAVPAPLACLWLSESA